MNRMEATKKAAEVGRISPTEIVVASDRCLCHQDAACQSSQILASGGTHEGHSLKISVEGLALW